MKHESAGNHKKDTHLAAFAQMAHQARQVFFVFHLREQQFIYLSPSFGTLWEASPEEYFATPRLLLETVLADDQPLLKRRYAQLQRGAAQESVEFRIQVVAKIKWVCVSTYRTGEEDELIAGWAEDITKRKENEQTTLKYNAQKNATLEILAHDLRAPLTTIQGIAYLLEKKLKTAQKGELIEFTALIKQLCERNLDLIQQLVSREFLESSEAALQKQRVDLVHIIGEVVRNYQQSEQALNRTFEFSSAEEKVYAAVDEMKLMQVVNNLVSNALKFTPEAGTITVTLQQEPAARGKHNSMQGAAAKQDSFGSVLLTFADNGVGIPNELQPHLFDRFTKARRKGLKGEESVGLGMSIVKKIVELHGGDIWVESEENQGTTFFIRLPIA